MSYAALELEVVRWAEDRKIVQNSNIQAQARKTLEEAGELLEAATALETIRQVRSIGMNPHELDLLEAVWLAKYKDAHGDVTVTQIVGCATADVDLMECLAQAYEEIKNRKGYLKPDGTFVKEV